MDARVKTYDDKMQKALDFLLSDYQTIRAGRANPHVLDKIKVDYYGNADVDSTGWKYYSSGGEDDTDRAMGEESDQGN